LITNLNFARLPEMIRRFIFFLAVLLPHISLTAQTPDSLHVIIRGRAFNSADPSMRLDDLMIINSATSQGAFGLADGSFSISIRKTDTILVASTGYEYKKLCVTDSVYRPSYYISVPLTKLKVNLKEVVIFSPRDLQSIYGDIQKLGYNKRDFEISGVDAMQSPITFLYQEFSRFEQLKRHNAERINADKRRELLKQLLANYVAHDIINLDNSEFEDFIDFCNVPEYYMKTATQYDFCIFIKQKFELYEYFKQGRKG
jgi:hypothetical protein